MHEPLRLSVPMLLVAAVGLGGCTHRLDLRSPSPTDAGGCGLVVTDIRPDVAGIYMKRTDGSMRGELDPSVAGILRSQACSAIPGATRVVPLKFTITDLDCTTSGFVEIRYVVDFRGRLEVPGRAPEALVRGENQVTYQGHVPTGCEVALRAAVTGMAAEIARAARN